MGNLEFHTFDEIVKAVDKAFYGEFGELLREFPGEEGYRYEGEKYEYTGFLDFYRDNGSIISMNDYVEEEWIEIPKSPFKYIALLDMFNTTDDKCVICGLPRTGLGIVYSTFHAWQIMQDILKDEYHDLIHVCAFCGSIVDICRMERGYRVNLYGKSSIDHDLPIAFPNDRYLHLTTSLDFGYNIYYYFNELEKFLQIGDRDEFYQFVLPYRTLTSKIFDYVDNDYDRMRFYLRLSMFPRFPDQDEKIKLITRQLLEGIGDEKILKEMMIFCAPEHEEGTKVDYINPHLPDLRDFLDQRGMLSPDLEKLSQKELVEVACGYYDEKIRKKAFRLIESKNLLIKNLDRFRIDLPIIFQKIREFGIDGDHYHPIIEKESSKRHSSEIRIELRKMKKRMNQVVSNKLNELSQEKLLEIVCSKYYFEDVRKKAMHFITSKKIIIENFEEIKLEIPLICRRLEELRVHASELGLHEGLILLPYIEDEKLLTEMIIDTNFVMEIQKIKQRLSELAGD